MKRSDVFPPMAPAAQPRPTLRAPRTMPRWLAVSGVALASAAFGLIVSGGLLQPARAQRVVPKLQTLCPLGYVDTLNGRCSTLGLMTYTVAPSAGRPCPEGWMDIGGGYCRQK